MLFPVTRKRRLRSNAAMRALVTETRLEVQDLIYPVFVRYGENIKEPIVSMPGQFRYTLDRLPEVVEAVAGAGIPGILLFGIPEHKDETGSEVYNPDGIVPQAVALIKRQAPEILVLTDLCLCEYTSHGHCGIISGQTVLNDPTLEILSRAALVYAQSGADIIAPSDMMDGRVKVIREALDAKGFTQVAILSYAAKFASAFYGPFREAAECTPQFGDRKSYQINPANRREALHDALLDVSEGADMLMVKPALPYLDIIREVRNATLLPLAAYNVSGEYAMIKAAAAQGWIDEHKVTLEALTAIKRAGADIILTYSALEVAGWLKSGA